MWAEARTAFETAHKSQFGFIYVDKPMVIEAISVEATDLREAGNAERELTLEESEPDAAEIRPVFCGGEWRDAGLPVERGAP